MCVCWGGTRRQSNGRAVAITAWVRGSEGGERGGGGGGGERLIKDLKRRAKSLSRESRQASALGLEEERGLFKGL